MRSVGRVLWLVILATVLAGAGPASAQSAPPAGAAAPPSEAEWKQVIAAAKKEGKVVMYSAAVGSPVNPRIAAAYEAKYGIRMEVLEARASELRERIRTEQAAGKLLGDVSHNGATTTALQLAEGTFQPYGSVPGQSRVVSHFKADGTRVPIYVIPYGILVNTEMVKPAEEPKSWKDLLDPRWKGKIISDDQRALGGGSVFFLVTYRAFGREYHEKLATQQLHWSRELRAMQRRVARGEYPLLIPMTLPDILDLKGLPVKAVTPAEGATYVRFDGAMLKNAPHPNAARLLLDFYLSDDVQTLYANVGYGVTVTGMEGKVSAEARPYSHAKLLGTSDPKIQDEMLKLAKEIYR